jgi:hypothetical protein
VVAPAIIQQSFTRLVPAFAPRRPQGIGICRMAPHIYFLIGFRNRLAVALHWFWNYVTFQRGTRLITGISGSRIEDVVPVVTTAPPTADVGHAHRSSRIADAYGRESPQHVRRDRILERPNEKRYSPLVDCCCPICSPGAIR